LATLTAPKKGENIFALTWDTNKSDFNDGKYWLKAVVKDLTDLESEAISDYFFIHNSLDNPPLVDFLGPHSGEVKGTIKLNASVFDLENNLDENGVYFEYSTDNVTWTLIGSDPSGRLEGIDIIFELIWDTTRIPDNIYWFRARARDDTGHEGIGISRGQIIIHNNLNNPPILILVEPLKDYELKDMQRIRVKVRDFEDDIDTVSFYYSPDMDEKSWKPIESKIDIKEERDYYIYTTVWDTRNLAGDFYINVRAVDDGGNSNQIIDGPFERGEEGIDEKGGEKESQDFTVWLILIIIIIIMVMIIVLLMRRSKKREKEIIEEVAVEAQRSQVLEGEIISTPMAGLPGTDDALQTYIPPQKSLAPQQQTEGLQLPPHEPEPDVETIEFYVQQMNVWKTEGYNVSRLEQLVLTDESRFARVFPIFSSNISKLKNISSQLNIMNTSGYEAEVDSINKKLYEPDQALATEQKFKELESKLGLATGMVKPGATPVTQDFEQRIPKLLPGETPSKEGENDLSQGPSGPIEVTKPVQETDAPPDVELPPDIDLPSTEQQEQKKPESEADETKKKVDEKDSL
jgi:hypothetical protein